MGEELNAKARNDDFIVSCTLRTRIRAHEAHRDVEVEIHVRMLLQTGTGFGGASVAVCEGSGFGGGGGICEETMRACCGPTAKTLPDCLPLHLLRPAVI